VSDELRGRYRALLRWYPTAYRIERGDEIVETYLDLAAPGQRRPRIADVADLVRGGARQHLRARGALGLADAVPFAAQLAMMTGAVLAALWLVLAERLTMWHDIPWHPPVPFATVGAAAWIVWVLVPLAAFLGLGRPAVAVALFTTVAVIAFAPLVPFAAFGVYGRPSLFVLVPQIALGVVALGVPSRRWSPVAAASIATTVAAVWLAHVDGTHEFYYALLVVPQVAGLLLVLAVITAGVVFTVRRDPRGWWPALILLGPVLLLAMTLPAAASPQPWPTWGVAAASAAVVAVTAAAAVPLTLWLRGRSRHHPAAACPTCGR